MQTLNWKISLLWIARVLVMVLPLCTHAQIEQVTHYATCPGKNKGRVILRIAADVYPKLNITLTDGRGIAHTKENVSTRSLEFANLYAGKYIIKIEIPGVTGCGIKEYSDVLPTLDIQLNLIELIKPQTTTSADGKITVAGSGGSNYHYEWEDGSTTASRSNLRVGEYTVTLTDGTNGCEIVKTFRLETECSSLHVIIDKIIQPKQDNSLDGSIKVSGNKGNNYTFHWNTGETSAEITQKAAGNYTVEIMDVSTGCRASETIKLLSCETKESISGAYSFGLISLNSEPIGSSENAPLQLLYFTGSSNEPQAVDDKFSVVWKNKQTGQILSRGSVLKPFPKNITGIIVEISDGCNVIYYNPAGSQCIGDVFADATLDITVQTKSACQGTDDASAVITINTTFPKISEIQLIQGNTVRLLPFKASDVSSGSFSITVGNLIPGKNYQIKVNHGLGNTSCVKETAFKTPTIETKKSEARYNKKTNLCEYTELCNGLQVGGAFNLKEPPKYNLDDLKGCKVKEVICGNQKFKDKVGGVKNMRIGEAIEFLNQIPGAEISPFYNLLQGKDPCGHVGLCLLDPFKGGAVSWNFDEKVIRGPDRDNNNCLLYKCGAILGLIKSNVKICPSDLTRPPGIPDNNGNADLNIVPTQPRTCEQRKASLIEMVVSHYNGKLKLLYGDKYVGSALENFLKSVDVFSPRIRCAKVTFCVNDLNLPVFADMSQSSQQCGKTLINGAELYKCDVMQVQIKTNNTYEQFVYESTSQAAMSSALGQAIINKTLFYAECACGTIKLPDGRTVPDANPINTTEVPGIAIPFAPNREGILTALREEEDTISTKPNIVLILDSLKTEHLNNFGYITYLGRTIPKGFIQSNEGFRLHNYSYGDAFVDKIDLPELVKLQQNWDTEQSTLVAVNIPNREYTVTYLDTLIDWEKKLASNSHLILHHLSLTDSTIVLGGIVKGTLYYENNNISSTEHLSAFVLALDTSGAIHSFNLIENIDTTQGIYFSENRSGTIMVASAFKNSNLLLNGQAYNPGTSEGLLLCKWNNGQFSPLKVIQPNAASKWKGVSLNAAADQINIAITSVDSLRISGDQLASNAGSNVVLAALSAQGTLKWQHRIQDSSLQVNKMGIVSDDAQGLLFALTYHDSLDLSGKRFTSAGQNDVLLGKLDAQGSLKWSRSVGTVDQEEVTQVSYSSGLFFYGGQFSGATKLRPMGEVWYDNRTPYNERVYISFVIDSTYVPDTTTQVPNTEAVYIPMDKAQQVTPLQVRTPQLETPEVQVYPNPFRNEVTIEFMLNSAANYTLRLIDNLGGTLKSIPLSGQVGYNAQTLQTNNLPAGMYFLQLTDGVGRLVKTLRIVKL